MLVQQEIVQNVSEMFLFSVKYSFGYSKDFKRDLEILQAPYSC